MQHAIGLAQRAFARQRPNPFVGCVIVKGGRVVATGFHARAGGPHAEVTALKSVRDARGATAYVTLEPCNHTGRTGPCTEALIAAGVARVVAATGDPNALVAGQGLEKLRQAGVTVEVGVCRAEA